VSGLEQTSFERCLSATPKRREAARGIGSAWCWWKEKASKCWGVGPERVTTMVPLGVRVK